MLTFIETPNFTKQIKSLIADDAYAEFQQELSADPEQGDLIGGSGGVRKVRWAKENTGKSSGIRVIYYYVNAKGQIYMFMAYPKSVKDDLTDQEIAILRKAVEMLKND